MSRRKTVWIVLAVALLALTAAVVLTACGASTAADSSASPGAGDDQDADHRRPHAVLRRRRALGQD